MAGHSKWANIRHRKAAQDAKRGKMFTKVATEITVAAKLGGGDPDANPRLRQAMVKARSLSMPKDNIDRAIKKGTGENDGAEYSEKIYEGYGNGGVAVIVECLTDNINRTVSEVRHAFSRHGGNLGTDGSVAWQFQQKGVIVYDKTKVADYEKLMELAIENGAEDVKEDGDVYEIHSSVEEFLSLKDALDTLGVEPEAAELSRLPENTMAVEGKQAESVQKLIDALEDNDDVQNVFHNAELPDG